MKNFLKLSLAFVMAASLLTGCNCFSKMAKGLDSVDVKCTPEVLALNNGKIEANIVVTLPEGYFNEKAIAKVTPVMVYESGATEGTPIFYQGSKVDDNYKVITGGKIEEKIEMDYKPEMRLGHLQLRVEVKCKDSFEVINLNTKAALSKSDAAVVAADPTSKEALEILNNCGFKVALGVNTIQADLRQEDIMEKMESGYKRVTNSVEESNLMYTISSYYVPSKATKSECIEAFKAIIKDNSENDRATQKLSAQGYASPDGPEKFNDKLSKQRSESAKRAMAKFIKEFGLDMDVASYGEDWEGFKKLVEASSIEDKNLILQVLSLYESSTQREEEIKNLSAVFSALKSEILPQLRRTKLVNSVDLIGKSDDEMMELVKADKLDELNVLEILHITSCGAIKQPNKQATLLKYAAEKYNNGVAYNNLGVVLAKQDKAPKAIEAFKKALECGAESSEVSRNLALAYLMEGDVEAATPYAKGADAKVQSMMDAAVGDYTAAAKELSGYNKALALIMVEDLEGAKSAIAKLKTANAMYLRAVIASLQGDVKTAGTQLTEAVNKNKKLAESAKTDVNLTNLFESGFTL